MTSRTFEYQQTPESVAETANWVEHQRDLIDLAERVVPLVLIVAGTITFVLGAFLLIRSHRRAAG